MLNRKTALFIFSLILLLSTTKVYPQGYKFESIKTYEAGENDINRESRVYQTSFNSSTTRYVMCEITLKNSLYNIQPQTHKAKWIYYKPDGSVFGTVSDDWAIETSWETTWFSRGWGWDDPGNWENGKYLIEFYMNDKYVSSISFFIEGGNYSAATIRYNSIRFFECGSTVPNQENRTYATTFSKSSSRYIYYEIYVDNLLYNVRNNDVTFYATYYKPNQEIFGQPILNYNIPSSWEQVYLHHGWGWPEPGNWDSGNYYVEVKYLGSVIASGYFTITNY